MTGVELAHDSAALVLRRWLENHRGNRMTNSRVFGRAAFIAIARAWRVHVDGAPARGQTLWARIYDAELPTVVSVES